MRRYGSGEPYVSAVEWIFGGLLVSIGALFIACAGLCVGNAGQAVIFSLLRPAHLIKVMPGMLVSIGIGVAIGALGLWLFRRGRRIMKGEREPE